MISPIKDFDGYFIDKNGSVYSNKKNGGNKHDITPLKLKEDKDGYLEVGIYKNGKRYFRKVHRLVAQTFIPNPNHLPQINHKDGNKKNNCVENLEWCTCHDNLLHSFRVLNRKPSISVYKPLKLTNKTTNETLYFNTIKDCAYYLHMSHEHLRRILSGMCDINKWRKGKMYKVEYCNIEDVTTIRKE